MIFEKLRIINSRYYLEKWEYMWEKNYGDTKEWVS